MSFELKQIASGIWSGSFSSFPSEVAAHGLSGRLGGVSKAPCDSLDLALHVGDEPEAVIVNRRRYLTALGLDAARLVTPEQVHGEAIARVTARDAGRGALSYDDAIAATDALITDEEDLPLLLCFADCTPILFLDPVRRAVGIAHGGWKGTVRRIAAKTVRRMQDEFGSRVEDILVGIGPSIGPCCYEVGAEVAEQFRAAFPGHERELFTEPQPGHTYLSLWAANTLQLEEAGIPREHIDCASVCTACNHAIFYSYRADGGRTGRMAAVIALKKQS